MKRLTWTALIRSLRSKSHTVCTHESRFLTLKTCVEQEDNVIRISVSDEKLVQLGEGNFGIVYKGYLDGHPVAVKCVKHGRKWLKALQSELKIFASLGYHQNVISLVGVVQQPLSFRRFMFTKVSCKICNNSRVVNAITIDADAMEIQIIIEFCGNGDLRSYLRKNRGRFCDLIQNDQVYSPCSITVPSGSSR